MSICLPNRNTNAGDFIPNVMDDVSDNDFITNRPLIIIFISAFVLLPLALLKGLYKETFVKIVALGDYAIIHWFFPSQI